MLHVSYILDQNFGIVALTCSPVSLPPEQEVTEREDASEGIARAFLDHYCTWN